MRTPATRFRARREEGAVAIMVALSMVGLCLVGAMVLDFGLVRFDKQANKSATDFAAAAGIREIAGSDGQAKPFRGVCEALEFLRANQREIDADLSGTWQDGIGNVLSGNPCANPDLLDQSCVSGDATTWAWFHGTADGGDITVDIKSAYDVADPLFAEEEAAVSADAGDPTEGGCDQIGVVVAEKEQPGLGRLAMPEGDLVSRVRSVARAVIGEEGDAAVALLLLEQHDCLALNISGNSGARVQVQGSGERPGLIHSDSLGDGANCSSTDKIIDGDFELPPRIWAENAETGTPVAPGVIGVYALSDEAVGARPEHASDPYPDQVWAEGQPTGGPVGRPLVGRSPVDSRYRLPVRNAIATAAGQWNLSPADAAAAGYTVLNSCTNPSSAAIKVFVNCPTGTVEFTSSATFTGDQVVFNGRVKVGGGTTVLSFPNASAVYIKGTTDPALAGLESTRSVRINHGSASSCDARLLTNRSLRSRLVIGSGPLEATGNAALRLCQTSVILADNRAGDSAVPDTDGEPPWSNAGRGYLKIEGGGGLDWTAPNAAATHPTQADLGQLEDLALWTETSAVSSIKGGGTLNMAGVFFLPNAAPFKIEGTGGQEIGADAQFVTRRLEVGGNGFLLMKPSADDAVTFPYFGDFMLVR